MERGCDGVPTPPASNPLSSHTGEMGSDVATSGDEYWVVKRLNDEISLYNNDLSFQLTEYKPVIQNEVVSAHTKGEISKCAPPLSAE